MAADSDGCDDTTTVVTCEGDLSDPAFPGRLEQLVGRLRGLLGDRVTVRKLEPWNSVRVTLSVPREAALRLRRLADEGSQQLRALGILSVQVEGDQVISLRLAGAVGGEAQEIVLRTAQDGPGTSSSTPDNSLSRLLSAATPQPPAPPTPPEKVQFRSPNVVCPPDSVVPRVPTPSVANSTSTPPTTSKSYPGPFPFASMNQAIHSRDNLSANAGHAPANTSYATPPPPYPGKHPPVTLSSPLLVNLLQNDGAKESSAFAQANGPVVSSTAAYGSQKVSTRPQVAIKSGGARGSSPNSGIVHQNAQVTSVSQSNVSVGVSQIVREMSVSQSNTSADVSQIIHQNARVLGVSQNNVSADVSQIVHQNARVLSVSQNSGGAGVAQVVHQNAQATSVSQNSVGAGVSQVAHKNAQLASVSQSNSNLGVSQIVHQNVQLTSVSQNSVGAGISQIVHPSAQLGSVSQNCVSVGVSQVAHQNAQLASVSQTNSNLGASQIVHQNMQLTQNNVVNASKPLSVSLQSKPVVNTSPVIPNSVSNSPLPKPTFPKVLTENVSKPAPVRKPTPTAPYRSCPPPYPTKQWEPNPNISQLLELTPSLTDLKPDDLDHLLPSLERELAGSPPELPEELTNSVSNRRTFLINPLTGEMEPQSSSESEPEEPSDVFTGLASPAISDEDTNSTIRPDTTTDQSDSETRSSHSDSGKHSRKSGAKSRDRGRDSPGIGMKPTEKIKLRLKLEKSEPVSPAYKVDVSFINTQPKKASATPIVASGEELRVPPLHISLRGRNHAVINNKKKAKFNADGSPVKPKIRKMQDHAKLKKSDDPLTNSEHAHAVVSAHLSVLNDPLKTKSGGGISEPKKLKKPKPNYDYSLITGNRVLTEDPDLSKHKLAIYNSHYKEKLKERRGSDSELARSAKKYAESNGLLSGDKKRRLSQTEQPDGEPQPSVLGSTNTGTVAALPAHKPRKEKVKVKEGFKSKEMRCGKGFSKTIGEKLVKQVSLPTGEIDMEAKFKQRLLEEPEKGIPRPPHRTEPENRIEQPEKVPPSLQTLSDPPPLKHKPPEPDKCNTPDRKPDISEKQAGRSPSSGAQGEDSGIESMDALSEKSPNQAGQSPHADLPKTQVPDILDIEAQLAKMEGLNGGDADDGRAEMEQCRGLTSALQDSLKQGTVSLTAHPNQAKKEEMPQVEVSLVPLKTKKPKEEDDLEPVPVRVAPPLYTYSNPEKGRGGSDSPSLSDSDSGDPLPTLMKGASLLEQLLIEIPDHQAPNSPSPAARSLRTRASSKMNSPELSSPVVAKQRSSVVAKRKRHESDSSNNSLEDVRNKKHRKCSENTTELIKACMGVDTNVKVNMKKNNKVMEESSDSDEPLIEKVRKHNVNSGTKTKVKTTSVAGGVKNATVNTRRSVRTAMPALNTRSKGDKAQPDSEVLRRKTRSAVSEGEGKRRKDVK